MESAVNFENQYTKSKQFRPQKPIKISMQAYWQYRVSQKKFTRLAGHQIKSVRPIFKTQNEMFIYQSKANLDCVHTMPAHFENDENCDGSKI